MKRFVITIIGISYIVTCICISILLVVKENHSHIEKCKEIEQLEPVHDTIWVKTDFPRTVRALIDVESSRNPNAVNSKSGASGILQLMPVYVKEANRILGEDVLSLNDRLDPVKTLEMFCIIQDYHNPTSNTDKAIALHNKGKGYYKLVKDSIY